MPLEFETGGDISTGGTYLKEEGTYQFVITAVDEEPTKKDGSLVDNGEFEIAVSVCAGTTPHQEDKIQNMTFYSSTPSDTEEQVAKNRKVHDRFWVAVNVLTPEQAQTKGHKFKLDLNDLVGRQFFAKMVKNNSGYLTAWSDFYHVDDPAMANIPRSKPHLDTLPATQRWIGERTKHAQEAGKKPAPTQKQQDAPPMKPGLI